jgi:hypothetical protein
VSLAAALVGSVLLGAASPARAAEAVPTTLDPGPLADCDAPGDAACGWRIPEADASRTVEVGQTPVPLEVVAGSPSGTWFPYPSAAWRVAGGALAPGIELLADGTFVGAATAAGTFRAIVEARGRDAAGRA